VTKVLRSDRGGPVPADALGYRDLGYPDKEVEAVVEMAYFEMLGRNPSENELKYWTNWLCSTHANSDTLRIWLMSTGEFVKHFGYVNPQKLHDWRGERWLEMMTTACSDFQKKNNGKWPEARDLHQKIVKALSFKK
jgi:hypothetical protein